MRSKDEATQDLSTPSNVGAATPQREPSAPFGRTSPVGLLILVLFVLLPHTGEAQGFDAEFTLLGGFISDRFEERLPMAPEIGVQAAFSVGGRIWVGTEVTTRMLREGVVCPDIVGAECPESAPWSHASVGSLLLKVNLSDGGVRPYLTGVWGTEDGGWRVVGGGVGLRWIDAISGHDFIVEGRHRDADRFRSSETDHWEVLFGLSCRF